MSTVISIAGLGFEGSVNVEDGESYCDALARAGFTNPDELDVTVNGESLEGAELEETPVEADAQVAATPKNAALG